MPTILQIDGFAVRIYTKDHRPAHVHVVKDRGNLKIYLEGPREPELRGRMSAADFARAVALVSEHYNVLVAAWDRINPTMTSKP